MTRKLGINSLQWIIVLCGCLLLPWSLIAQTYSWKLVAPFPYYRAEHTLCGNNIYLAYGRIIDSLNESGGIKTEIGTTPFFMTSVDAKTWKQITLKVTNPADKAGNGAGEEIVPLKILCLSGSFIALARNAKNEKKIYRSENGTVWHSTGINAASMNFIRDRLIVENDLMISVSADGKQWSTYGAVFKDEPERHKNIKKEFRTVSIVAEDPSSVSFNGDSTRGYYTDSSYVLTDNDRTVGISRDGVHWRVVERPIFENDSLVEGVVGYVYGNKRFVYVTGEYFHSSVDGKKWERIVIDTRDPSEEFDTELSSRGITRFSFCDSLYLITQELETNTGGFAILLRQYTSANGKVWKRYNGAAESYLKMENLHESSPGEWVVEYFTNLEQGFRLSAEGQLTKFSLNHMVPLVYYDDQFVVSVEPHKKYYCSKDGYTWHCEERNFAESLFYESDPFFKGKRLHVRVTTKEILSQSIGCDSVSDYHASDIMNENGSLNDNIPIVLISKDRSVWDTIRVDSLEKGRVTCDEFRSFSRGRPMYLTTFFDGLRLTLVTVKGGMWFSSDGRKWSLLVGQTKIDSCRKYADLNAEGKDREIYIFSNGVTNISDNSGTQWYTVTNKCVGAKAVCWGNGRFVATGKFGRVWVLVQNLK